MCDPPLYAELLLLPISSPSTEVSDDRFGCLHQIEAIADDEIEAPALRGRRLLAKSTNFYPKLAAGLVLARCAGWAKYAGWARHAG